MPRKPESLSLAEKVKVAIGVLALESFGDSDASKVIAEQFDISPRMATSLRNQAYSAIESAFLPQASTSRTDNLDALMAGLNRIVGEPDVVGESEAPTEEEVNSTLNEVWERIKTFNDKNPKKIFPSLKIFESLTEYSEEVIQDWLNVNDEDLKTHIEAHSLKPSMNKGNRNFAELLGYSN